MSESLHRCSIRLKGYNYSQSGAYFITICTHNRKCLFGHIDNGIIILNDAGKMVEKWCFELENKFHDIQCIEHIVMPNHIHFIIQNVGADLRVCPESIELGEHTGSPLPRIIQWLKTMSTNEYIRNVKINHWLPFTGKFWQRNYYEHIVRSENELNRIRQYIIDNPANWMVDENYHE